MITNIIVLSLTAHFILLSWIFASPKKKWRPKSLPGGQSVVKQGRKPKALSSPQAPPQSPLPSPCCGRLSMLSLVSSIKWISAQNAGGKQLCNDRHHPGTSGVPWLCHPRDCCTQRPSLPHVTFGCGHKKEKESLCLQDKKPLL